MTWRAVFYFFFGCFLGGYAAWANAGYALASPPAGMGFVPGVGYTWKPPVSTPPANGTWSAHGFVKHAGKNIPLPASWGAAANAATFAKNAVRFNPALFVGSSVALWLASEYLLEWDQESQQWTYSDPTAYGGTTQFRINFGPVLYSSPEAACGIYSGGSYIHSVQAPPWVSDTGTWHVYGRCKATIHQHDGTWIEYRNYTQGVARPATEEDWNFAPVGPLTDTQLDEVSRINPQGLPVTNPVLEPVTEQIGQPYTDPVTGEQWRDMVRITPDPTSSSPTRVRIDEYREPMTTPEPSPENPNPSPELDPNRNPEELPPELPLFCDWAGVVCDLYEWFTDPFEEPEAVEVPYLDELDFDTSPLSLPSSGSCPPPQSMSLGLGSFALEFTPMCDLAAAIRPLVLAAAFLLAAFIVVGVRR